VVWGKKTLQSRKVKQSYSPLVSVIIPAWNEEVGILTSIKSVLAEEYGNVEIIVVNDGSTDKTAKVVNRFLSNPGNRIDGKTIRYFRKKNGGKGSALNYGIKRARGSIIVTMDADSAHKKDAIVNLVRYFSDPTVDAVVGNVKVRNNRGLVGLLQRIEYVFGFYFKRVHSVFNAEYIFGGACAAFRKSTTFDRLGMFDTENKTEGIEYSM